MYCQYILKEQTILTHLVVFMLPEDLQREDKTNTTTKISESYTGYETITVHGRKGKYIEKPNMIEN